MKFFALLLCVLLLLAGCSAYSRQDVEAMQDTWDETYAALEQEYYSESARADRYESALSDLYNEYLTLRAACDDLPNPDDSIPASLDTMQTVFAGLGF